MLTQIKEKSWAFLESGKRHKYSEWTNAETLKVEMRWKKYYHFASNG
jgi:hypothetical protein